MKKLPSSVSIDIKDNELKAVQTSRLNLLNLIDKQISKSAFMQSPDNSYPSPIQQTESDYEFLDKEVIVSLNNIHKTYLLGLEGVAALRGVSLDIYKGEWVAIYGTSGGGKTSLLNIIGTIDLPTKGDLKVCNTTINSHTKDKVFAELRLQHLGFVFQTFNLIGSMTARENVELPMILRGKLSKAERKVRAEESLKKVGLGHRLDQMPNKLSGGEQQRVTIARALANNPQLLLLDEPTGDLDTNNTHNVISLLHKLNSENSMTMLMVTHDVYLKNFCHRIIYMRDGKVAKIEIVPKHKRQEAFNDLNLAIEKSLKVKNPMSSHDILKSTQSLGNIGPNACTEVRDPKDYETYSPNTGIPGIISDGYFKDKFKDYINVETE